MKPRLLDLFCGAGGCAKGYQRAGFYVVGVDINPQPRYCGDEFVQGDALEYCRQHGHEFDAIHASPPCQAYCSLKSMPNAKKHPDFVVPTREVLRATGLSYVIENVPGAPLIDPTVLCGTMFGLGTGDAELWRHRLFETNWSLVLEFGMFCKHGRRSSLAADTIGIYGTDGRGRSTGEIARRRSRTICVIGQRGIAESCGDRKRSRTIMVTGAGGVGRDPTEERIVGKERRKTITVTGSHGDAGLSKARQMKRPNTVGVWGNSGGTSKRGGLLYFSTAERNEAMGIDWMKGGEISQAIPPAFTEFIGRQLMAAVAERGAA